MDPEGELGSESLASRLVHDLTLSSLLIHRLIPNGSGLAIGIGGKVEPVVFVVVVEPSLFLITAWKFFAWS